MVKKIILSLFALSLFFIGCSDLNTNTNPVNSAISSKTAIKLPLKTGINIESVFSASQLISGSNGGSVQLHNSYMSGNTQVTIDAELSVPAGAFTGSKTISMQIGDDAAIDFSPSSVFNIPLVLNLKITGVDLTGINPNDINFYYFAQDGSVFSVQNDGITIVPQTGTLEITNAKLPHFSRYGWGK